MKNKKSKGFSLLELLIVITLAVVILVTSTNLLLGSFSASNKASRISLVRQNGDHALSLIEKQTQDAVDADCTTHPGRLIIDNSRTTFRFFNDGTTDRIARHPFCGATCTSPPAGITYLTSDELAVSNFACSVISSGAGEPDTVRVSFRLALAAGLSTSEAVSEDFETQIALRTY